VIATGYSADYTANATGAAVVVSGLKAVVTYRVYCTVRTAGGEVSNGADLLATAEDVSTDCCRQIAFTSAPSFVYGTPSKYTPSQARLYVFSYALSAAPEAALTVTPVLYDTSGAAVLSSVLSAVPSFRVHQPNSTILSGSFVLSAASELLDGSYRLQLTPSGAGAAEYSGPSTFTTVHVLASAAAAPTPTLLSAKFQDSGAGFTVTFSSATNRPGITAISFACSALFDFTGVASTSCSWVSSSAVRVQFLAAPAGTRLIAADADTDSEVRLLPGLIRAACSSGSSATTCASYAPADAQTVSIQLPDSPVTPTVVLRVPSLIAECDDVLVDPTLTSGSGGRGWQKVQWTVLKQVGSEIASSGDIAAVLDDYGPATAQLISIPKQLLSSAQYTLSLSVTNFLGQSATATASFTVNNNANLPVLNILGPSTVSIKPSQSLAVFAAVSRASCAEAGVAVSYRWRLLHDGRDTALKSTSASPTMFRLPASVLNATSVYTLEFQASVGATANYAAAVATESVTVRVENGAIVAVVQGGNFRSLASPEAFLLDASASYDENYVSRTTSQAALSYVWSCRIISNTQQYGQTCDALLVGRESAAQLSLLGSALDIGTTYEFLVTASSADGRSSSFAVAVLNNAGSTATSITTAASAKVNPGKRLTLTGTVSGGYALDCSWSASVDGVTQTIRADTPLTGTLAVGSVRTPAAFPLAVPASTFSAGSAVTFRLTAFKSGTEAQFASYSEITLVMNAPPSGGTVMASVQAATALADPVTFTAASWADDATDLPLAFDYVYRTAASQPALTIQSRGASNMVTSVLPAGQPSQRYAVTVTCNVYDSYLAASAASVDVTVTVAANTDVAAYVSAALSASLLSKNVDSVSQAVANAATTVNAVNCSAAPDTMCAGLNRGACYNTPQTCSSCLPGYTGRVGQSNSPCRSASEAGTLGQTGETCAVDADCALDACVAGRCVVPPKPCPSVSADACSGHGACAYVDSTGRDVGRVCDLSDSQCTARCACADGYGGSACTLTPSELSARDSTRAQLCEAVLTISEGSDVSSALLDSLVAALFSAYDPEEVVSVEAQQACFEALQVLGAYARQGFLSDDSTSTIIETAAKYLQSSGLGAPTGGARRALTRASAEASNAATVDDTMQGIISGMLGNMASGQQPQSFANDQVQLVVFKGVTSGLLQLIPPLSEGAAAYGSGLTSYVELSPAAAALMQNADGYTEVSVLLWGSNPFPGSQVLQSPLLRLQVFSTDLSASSSASNASREAQQADFYATLQFSTAQDFNFSLTIAEAMEAGVRNFTVPVCASYDGTQYERCDCWVDSYTNYNVTFGCPLATIVSAEADSVGSRRLSGSTSSAKLQLGSALGDTDGVLRGTLSQNPFRVDYATAKVVMIFLAALAGTIILGLLLFRRWDRADQVYFLTEKAAHDRRVFCGKHQELLALRRCDRTALLEWQDLPLARKQAKYLAAVHVAFRKSLGVQYHAAGDTDGGSGGLQEDDDGGAYLDDFGGVYSSASAAADMFEVDSLPWRPAPEKSQHSSPLKPQELVITPTANRQAPLTTESQHDTARYDALLEAAAADAEWERDVLASDSVASYLGSLFPAGSLTAKGLGWRALLVSISKQHKYTAMFFGRSMRRTRVIRWVNLCLSVLLNLFVDTVLYSVFYPDDGLCEGHSTEDQCLGEQSLVYNAGLCRWDADSQVVNGGSCAMKAPPNHFVFLIVVVAVTVVVSLPIQFLYDYLLFGYCARRPRLEDLGWGATEGWLGQTTRDRAPATSASPLHTLRCESRELLQARAAEEVERTGATEIRPGSGKLPSPARMSPTLSAEEEAGTVLADVHTALVAKLASPLPPWQTAVDGAQAPNTRAIRAAIDIQPDGRPAPLTVWDWLWYRTPRGKLSAQISAARCGAERIQMGVQALDAREPLAREKLLLQSFILEQFTSYRRFLARRFLFDFGDTSPEPVSPWLWALSWAFLVLSLAFFLYWAFLWSVSQGGNTAVNWGINLGISVAQDAFVVQAFRVYILHVLSLTSIQPQLGAIYRVLNRAGVAYAQDTVDPSQMPVSVVQHLSPACRAARSVACTGLLGARILMLVDDGDALTCRKTSYRSGLMLAGTALLALPLVAALLGDVAGGLVLETLLPAALDGLLVSNYYFYSAAGLLIVVPYAALAAYLIYGYTQRRSASRKQEASRDLLWRQSARGDPARTEHTSLLSAVCGPLGLWRSENAPVAQHEPAAPSGNTWEQSNAPLPRPYMLSQRSAQSAPQLDTPLSDLSIPSEVCALQGVTEDQGAWLDAWDANTGRTGYLAALLGGSRVSSGRVPSASRPQQARAPVLYEDEHSERSSEDAGHWDVVGEALGQLLERYRDHVRSGDMALVDPEEASELSNSTALTCNVLVEFADLRTLLREWLSANRPHSSSAERERVVDSCYSWVAALGDDLLDVHYGSDSAKIAQASLVRTKSLGAVNLPGSPVGSPHASGASSKPSRKGAAAQERVNFPVPFQELRYWAENSAALLLGPADGLQDSYGDFGALQRGNNAGWQRAPSGSLFGRQLSMGEEISL
jgi:hypothetical protein